MLIDTVVVVALPKFLSFQIKLHNYHSNLSTKCLFFQNITMTITSENHSEVVASFADATQELIEANLEGMKKMEIRAVLKSIKDKLHPENGIIKVTGIKKNALILAGYQGVKVLDTGAVQGSVPKEARRSIISLSGNSVFWSIKNFVINLRGPNRTRRVQVHREKAAI